MRYKAFMSYCHADETWATWLHKALESYRVPRRLVGTAGSHGPVPARLTPIFRDREELSSGADLSEKIKAALANSESLVVVCSPAAARSRWVNEEIRHFRSLGNEGRIYCVIIDGDPQASDPQHECFPPALLEREDHRPAEPLAADVRKWADGKPLAKLKLAAGLLGVRLDELRQREQQRRRKIQAVFGALILAAAALILFSIQSRLAENEARIARETQQAAAENMLAGFLEQSERLGDVADIETRKVFMEVLSSYLDDLDPKDLTLESRRQLGVALLNQGVILREEEQLDQAMDVFLRARDILQLLVSESSADAEALFELSQVEYWIGQVHLDLGRMQEANVSFKSYAEVSAALHSLQPDNADWTMEVAYAQSNLGNLENLRTPSDPQLTRQYHEAALEFNEAAARQDKRYEAELAESHANLADAWLGVCSLPLAMENRLRNVELAALHHKLNPASNILKQDYAYALSGLSGVQLMTGELERAAESLQHSLDLLTELVKEDPNNLKKRWNRLTISARQAKLLELSGRLEESWGLSLAVNTEMQELMSQGDDVRLDHALKYGMFLRDFAHLAYRKGDTSFADAQLDESITKLGRIANEHPDSKQVPIVRALSYFYYWEQNDNKLPSDSANDWLSGLGETLNFQACAELDMAARISLMAAEEGKARHYVSQLVEKGYREPEFMRFCKKYELCTE